MRRSILGLIIAILFFLQEASALTIRADVPNTLPIDPFGAIDPDSVDNVQFLIPSKGLYRPSGSTPYDRNGIARASVSLDVNASLDTLLEPIVYQGINSMGVEVPAYIRIKGRRDAPHDVKFPIKVALLFSPNDEGTRVTLKPTRESGDTPTDYGRTVTIYGTGYGQGSRPVMGATFSADGASAVYDYAFEDVIDTGTLKFLPNMTSSIPISSSALAVERVNVKSQLYLSQPGRRQLGIFYSANPVPEPTSLITGFMACIMLCLHRRQRFGG